MKKANVGIVVGPQQYMLVKCKHSWNNGTVVQVVEKRDEDTFVAVDITNEKKLFIVGQKNLQPV